MEEITPKKLKWVRPQNVFEVLLRFQHEISIFAYFVAKFIAVINVILYLTVKKDGWVIVIKEPVTCAEYLKDSISNKQWRKLDNSKLGSTQQ